ncbi:MAG: NADH-quinone oxidoreductase subunit F [Nanoarchaeota archaeon]|nr:NADH-quinone oxidoreductase subunit F [Nanoarchaeota archaeon]
MKILQKTNLEAYEKAKRLGSKKTVELIKKKGLTGRGGGGFPTGLKWEFALKSKGERFLIVNADEGEPGTFKDKFIIENNPELLAEGILIACHTLSIKEAYIYLRGEYNYLKDRLERAIKNLVKKTKAKSDIKIVSGAGAYVCGDETAIIQSIEGKRGQPYIKPPYPTDAGLWEKPTVINNVETLANIPLLLLDNDWNNNLRLFSLSGNIEKPGVYEIETGTNLKYILDMVKPKNRIKAVYFGCSGGCIPVKDIKMEKESVARCGCMLGCSSLIFVDEKQSIVDMATNIAKFFEYESCGKCTPCREGTMRVLNLLQEISLGNATKKDLQTLEELTYFVRDCSLCGLGQSSMNHLITALNFFRKEFEERCR